ncbi:MAG: (2Fe-2S) ferredoxin domain-containing protein [Spirochaetaceae bacterium]|nr:(2Fe-2S) ferredoxin domain-containing protein [Spirochaetaceae bacterium]MBR6566248.1 (2Fe-2S) ferredoxin domain-containing protein [Spirochaetaceae bacterium]
MAKLTLEDLRALRAKMKKSLDRRDPEGKSIQVIVGMGTCGIAAGGKETFRAFLDEVEAKGLDTQVIVRQSGCMSRCAEEPTVEVVVPGMETVIYGKVTPAMAKDIVQTHLIDRKLLDNLIVERVAPSK